MLVIGEPAPPALQVRRDLLFERHPRGEFIKGEWKAWGAQDRSPPTSSSSSSWHTPTMLLLDEFQTWYDGLTNTKRYWKNGRSTLFRSSQYQRTSPTCCWCQDLRSQWRQRCVSQGIASIGRHRLQGGGNPERVQQDRRRMLHRLFLNCLQIADGRYSLIEPHVTENLCG